MGITGKEIFLRYLAEVAAANVPPKKPADVARIRVFLTTLTFDSLELQNNNYADDVSRCVENRDFMRAHIIYEGIENIPNLPNTNFGKLSQQFVFAHEYEGAILAGEHYKANGGWKIGSLSYLAMGYLYNGQYEKAYALYAKYKNEIDESGTGKEIFLADLEAVATANVPPKKPEDVAQIIQFLKE